MFIFLIIFLFNFPILPMLTILFSSQLPPVNPSAKLLQPPLSILQNEGNWPLLTVAKTFFEGAMAAKGEMQ